LGAGSGAADADLWSDATWIVDSAAVECRRSRLTVKRSDLAGWGRLRLLRIHSRFFWRLHLICTPAGLPITWAVATPKRDERQVLTAVLEHDSDLLTDRLSRVRTKSCPAVLRAPRGRTPEIPADGQVISL
jgi:hypothetical protein